MAFILRARPRPILRRRRTIFATAAVNATGIVSPFSPSVSNPPVPGQAKTPRVSALKRFTSERNGISSRFSTGCSKGCATATDVFFGTKRNSATPRKSRNGHYKPDTRYIYLKRNTRRRYCPHSSYRQRFDATERQLLRSINKVLCLDLWLGLGNPPIRFFAPTRFPVLCYDAHSRSLRAYDKVGRYIPLLLTSQH